MLMAAQPDGYQGGLGSMELATCLGILNYGFPVKILEAIFLPYVSRPVSRPEPLLFLPSSSSIVLTSLSEPRSRPTNSQKIW
jgi:hypothetical protein